MSVQTSQKITIDKQLLSHVIEDVLVDYIELQEDKVTKTEIENDISLQDMIGTLKNKVGKS